MTRTMRPGRPAGWHGCRPIRARLAMRKHDLDPDEQHLLALHKELARHGVRSVLYTHGIRPRLRIHRPDERLGCSFYNNDAGMGAGGIGKTAAIRYTRLR
jgi:hypothetical protein